MNEGYFLIITIHIMTKELEIPRFLICRESPVIPGYELLLDTWVHTIARIVTHRESLGAWELYLRNVPFIQPIPGYKIALQPYAKLDGRPWNGPTDSEAASMIAMVAFMTAHIAAHPTKFKKYRI